LLAFASLIEDNILHIMALGFVSRIWAWANFSWHDLF